MSAPTVRRDGRGAVERHTDRHLVGDGLLHSVLLSAAVCPPGTVVLCRDGWDPERDPAEQAALVRTHREVMPVRLVSGAVVIGPWVRAGRPGCQVCAMRRRALWQRQNAAHVRPGDPEPAGYAALGLAEHVAAVLQDVLTDDLLGDCETYVLTQRLTGEVHRFVPLAACPGCSTTPVDSAERARVTLQPRPQRDARAFRTNPAGLAGEAWRRRVMDWRYGPVGHVFRADNSAGALFCAEVALPHGGHGEGGYGRATTYSKAESIAFYEAAERLESATPARTRTAVHAAEQDLDHAIDVASLGLHETGSAGHPLFRMAPYSPATATDWVWAWNLTTESAVLVPEHAVYWAVDPWCHPTGPGPRFLYESSNGAAIGSTVEEAVLYGIFEVLERDAFLMTWYTRRPARRLEVGPELGEVVAMRHSLAALGYQLHFFDTTTELRVPSVMSVVVRDDDEGPVAFFAAGTHCDPAKAILAAAHEAVTNATVRVRSDAATRAADETRARRRLTALDQVETLHDHTALYNLPETRAWWSFLDTSGPTVTLDEAFGDWRSRWVRTDLTDTLREVLEEVRRAGLEVLVVNETDPLLGPDHATVKVLIPGAVPMTFGHVNRRLRGLARLRTVPLQLGYRHEQEVYPHVSDIPPHPFP